MHVWVCTSVSRLFNFFPPADNSSKNRIRPVQ